MSSSSINSHYLFLEFIRLMAITLVVAITEVICYIDAGHIYAGIMTGNTVQFGWAIAAANWQKAAPIALAIGSFVFGCIVVGICQSRLKNKTLVYGVMAILLLVASIARLHSNYHMMIELPILAFTIALQGEAFSNFAGVGIQTIVVTNNLVKFSKSFAGRYINPPKNPDERPSFQDVWINGVCWLTYAIGAGIGGVLNYHFIFPLLLPVIILVLLIIWNVISVREARKT